MSYNPNLNLDYLLDMLRWQRPDGSVAQTVFCELYLEPVFGKPDNYGNYVHTVLNEDGSFPEVCFTAHHDTVHFTGGFQTVEVALDTAYTPDGDCLGADCTTGIFIILEMIDAEVPGQYVIHGGEEIGCVGSSGLITSNPSWLDDVRAVISFDRYGTNSVVTHQMSYRTCSDEFANSLIDILDLGLTKDKGGVYTDSNEYRDVVPECTNIAVGYDKQHSKYETQDLDFLRALIPALIEADWSQLVFKRDPSVVNFESTPKLTTTLEESFEVARVEDLLYDHADEVASYLVYIGYTAQELRTELGLTLEVA
jgi:hypothetical protein